MNESGINATLNMGNYAGTSQASPAFVPICMALTLGLCLSDFDQSGSHDIEDLMEAATFWNRANSYDIHITSPRSLSAGGDPAVVAEVNNHMGFAFRYSSDEPSVAPYHLLLTNHHRVLYPPISCYRYQRMLDSLATDPDITLDRLWNFMGAVGEAPIPGVGGTLQTMIFQPEQRRTGLAFASSGVGPFSKPPQWIEWTDIYPNHFPEGIEEGEFQEPVVALLGNPVTSVICVSAQVASCADLALFDLDGRRMDAVFTEVSENVFTADVSHLAPSVYFVKARSSTGDDFAQVLVLR
jgi:hypothetical protein